MKGTSLRQGKKPPVSKSAETNHSIALPFIVSVLAAPLVGAELTTIIRAAHVPGCEEVKTICDVGSLTNTHTGSDLRRNVVLVAANSGWDMLTKLWMQRKPFCLATVLALDCKHPNTYIQIATATVQGVRVFLTTDDPSETLSRALGAAARGQTYTSNRLKAALGEKANHNDMLRNLPTRTRLGSSSHDSRTTCWVALSKRQREVALLAAEGLSNQEIAGKLFIDITTVKTHLEETYRKMGICRRSQLVHHLIMAL